MVVALTRTSASFGPILGIGTDRTSAPALGFVFTTARIVSAMIPFPSGLAVGACAVALGAVSPNPGGPDAVR